MNKYDVNNPEFKNSTIFKNFIKNNPMTGYLKIRAYAANQAIPIQNLSIEVSTTIDNNIIVFYKGVTDESGIIEKIPLPAPILDQNNLYAPNSTTYNITATYKDAITNYVANIYENVYVVQNINIIPKMNIGELNGY